MANFTRSSNRFWLFLFGGMACLILFFVIGLIIGIFAVPHNNKATCRDSDYLAQEDGRISDLFMKEIDPKKIEANLEHLTSTVHRAGTPEGNAVAQFIHDSFRNYGLDKAEMEEYDVLVSYPNNTQPDQVTLVNASNGEILVNISNGRSKMLVPGEEDRTPNADVRFNGFAKAGTTTTAKVVYANYGTQSDFEHLLKENINLQGAIVLIRYRKLWRGAKVQVAERLGAAGVLLYSDPQQETYQNQTSAEATYPNTVYMPDSAVQRGTVVYRDAGDVLTPLLPSKDYVIRHEIDEAYNTSLITKIPVTPISYSDAQKLLNVIRGPRVPASWQGGLPIDYNLGPEIEPNQNLRMTVTTYQERRSIRNVIGYIRGSVEPDRYVVVGNHHDAWVYGAIDPSSGTAVMLEMARAFASVHNATGWRPRRTLVFCAWDAEEQGLVGSSEFIEQYLRRFDTKTIAYLNVDCAVTGNETSWAKTVPLLKKVLFASAKKVPNPDSREVQQGRKTVYDTWLYKVPDKRDPSQPWLDSIGSGSDYRHFLDFVGIPSLDFRYAQTADRSYPLYHTIHETMHLVKLIDPQFAYHQAVGRMWGEMARSLADSLVVPFNVSDYGQMMKQSIESLAEEIKKSPAASYANITHIRRAGQAFEEATATFDTKLSALLSSGDYSSIQIRIANDQLMHLERMFILPFGLPGRSYLRHVVFAPSIDDTYSGVLFAGITDTLNQLAKFLSTGSSEDVRRVVIILNDQISWVAHCIYSAVDLLTRDL